MSDSEHRNACDERAIGVARVVEVLLNAGGSAEEIAAELGCSAAELAARDDREQIVQHVVAAARLQRLGTVSLIETLRRSALITFGSIMSQTLDNPKLLESERIRLGESLRKASVDVLRLTEALPAPPRSAKHHDPDDQPHEKRESGAERSRAQRLLRKYDLWHAPLKESGEPDREHPFYRDLEELNAST